MSLYVDIEKRLGTFRLQIKFETGNHVLALLGASGCGKSMTLKCIAGIEKPDRGKIVLDGRVLFDSEKRICLPPQKRRAGYLFQQYALFPNMTVEQNIACGVREKERRASAVKEAIEMMGLNGLEHKMPIELSGGEQQRTALARILVNEPDVLLLDEPFSALDSHLRFRLEQELRSVIRRFGKTVLLVSHDRDEVFRLSSEIGIMKNGCLEAVGPKHEIFKAPLTVNGAVLTGCKNISPIRWLDHTHVYAESWGWKLRIRREANCGSPLGAACSFPGSGFYKGSSSDSGSSQNRSRLSGRNTQDGVTHIGIRMHDVKICSDTEEENSALCEVAEEIENPFSITVMLRPVSETDRTSEPGAGLIGMELGKADWAAVRKNRLRIALPAEGILLLRDSSR